MNEHSKLEGISKSNPTTQTNIETQLLNTNEEEPQGLVKYLLIQLIDNDGKQCFDFCTVFTSCFICFVIHWVF